MADKKSAHAKKQGYDPMKRKQTRALPYAPSGEQQSLYVSLNGRTWNVPRGKPVSLPMAVWEVVDRAMDAEHKREQELRRHN